MAPLLGKVALSDFVFGVDSRGKRGLVFKQFRCVEESSDLFAGCLDRVGCVNEVSLNAHRPVSANGPRRGFTRLGYSAQAANGLNTVQPLETYRDGGGQLHKPSDPGKKRLVRKMTVVVIQERVAELQEFYADELQPFLFKARDDLAYKSPLNRIGLD